MTYKSKFYEEHVHIYTQFKLETLRNQLEDNKRYLKRATHRSAATVGMDMKVLA